MIVVLFFVVVTEDFLLKKNGGCYYGTYGIKVSSLLLINANEKDIDYCNLLRSSFKNDKAFRKFISLQFYDGPSIDHANVVYEIYEYYGDEIFWKKTKKLSKKEKRLVKEYLDYAISEQESYEK